MALSVGKLVGHLGLEDKEFDSKLGKAEGRMGRFGKMIGGAVAGGAVAAAGAIAAFTAYGVKEFMSLERGMNEVFTLLPNASEQAMSAMTDDVRAFSVEMGVAHEDAVPALYQAISAGVPAENVFDFMRVAAKASIGGVTSLETAVDGITSVVNAYGEEAVDAGQASDLMFTAVRLGKTTFDELSSSLFQVNPIASALGVEFGDVTAALASMTAQGVPTSVATTQLRQAFVEMSKEGTKTSDLFQELAGKSFKDFIAAGGNTQDALQLLEEHANKTGVGINDLFGSVEAGAAALALTGGGTDAFSDALDAMADSAGATEAAYNQMEGGLSRSMERIKIAFTDAAIGVGQSLAPALQTVADWVVGNMPLFQAAIVTALSTVGEWIQKLSAWWTENRDTVLPVLDAIGTAATFLGGILLTVLKGAIDGVMQVLSGLVQAGRGVIDFFRAVFAGEWGAAWEAVKQIAVGVFNVIVGAIKTWLNVSIMGIFRGGLLSLAKLWKGGLDTVRSLATGALSAVRSLFAAGLNAVVAVVRGGLNLVVGFFRSSLSLARSIVTSGITAVRSVFTSGLNAVRSLVSSVLSAVVNFFRTNLNNMRSAVTNGVNAMRTAFSNGMTRINSAVRSGISSLLSQVRALPGRIKGGLGNLGRLLYGAGQDVIRGLIDGVKNMAGAAAGAVKDVARGALNAAKNFLGISSPSKVFREIGHFTGEGLELGLLDERASVRRAAEALAHVPDASIPAFTRGDGSVWDRATGFGSTAVMPTITAPGLSGRDLDRLADRLADAIGPEFRDALKRHARDLETRGKAY